MSATGTNTSVLAIRQLRRQSATAASYATHTTDAVAAHQCHEHCIHTHAAECLQRAFIPVSRYVKDIKIHQDFPELWPQTCCHVFSYSKSALWVWKVIISFSQGSISTLFKWGGYVFMWCIKRFFLLTAMQKLFKSSVFFQSYDHKCTATFFGSQCILPVRMGRLNVWRAEPDLNLPSAENSGCANLRYLFKRIGL